MLKARKRLQAMAPGERLRVLATDPKAPADFRLYCSESGHRLIEEAAEGAGFVLLLERGGLAQPGMPVSVRSTSQSTTAAMPSVGGCRRPRPTRR